MQSIHSLNNGKATFGSAFTESKIIHYTQKNYSPSESKIVLIVCSDLLKFLHGFKTKDLSWQPPWDLRKSPPAKVGYWRCKRQILYSYVVTRCKSHFCLRCVRLFFCGLQGASQGIIQPVNGMQRPQRGNLENAASSKSLSHPGNMYGLKVWTQKTP